MVKGIQTKLILVDLASQEFFGKLRPNYYRGSSACIIVFNKSDRESFEKVTCWLEDFKKHIPQPNLPTALLAINTDFEDVSSDEGKTLAESLNLRYFETSSPKFENGNEIFDYLAREVIK
jgi:GTPase SAR1 family protein